MKKKHKIALLVIGILLALSLMLSSSYALWVFNVSQESTNVMVSDCFEITLTDNNPIGLSASFPMRDSDGVKTTPYTFTIKNICNHPADFQINLETLNISTIDESFIKADLNGHITEYNAAESVELTIEGARSAAMLYEDTLAVNSSKTYNLRIWVNEIATQEDVENKSYASKISARATVRKQFAEGTLVRGQQFNAALKKLADGGNPSYTSNNTSITSIEWSNVAPQESDDAVNLAVEGTTTPIYAWFKDGTIYINSELDKIYMNSSSSNMFYKMQGVTSLDLSHFDTSRVTDMRSLFAESSNLEEIDVSHFDTSNVTNMSVMFGDVYLYGTMNLKQITGLENFDTSKVTNMSNMFSNLIKMEEIDISHFDTSNVTNMSYMFYRIPKLKKIDVSNFNTSKVTNMSYMFGYPVIGYTSDGRLAGSLLEKIIGLENFDTSNVTNMTSLFHGDCSLKDFDLSHFNTSNVTNMSEMFSCVNLNSIDLSHFDTSKVTNMSGMFSYLENIKNIDLSHFNTSNVKNMSSMFNGMRNLTSLDLSQFDTSNVTKMSGMFSNLENIKNIDLSHFDTSKVTDMSDMFNGMRNLTSLDLSNFDTSSVTDMSRMFTGMRSLTSLDLSHFNTSNVTEMSSMFSSMDSLTSLDLSHFDTSKVTNMSNMFYYAQSLTDLNISSFNTSNVTNMSSMFNGMSNLASLDLSSFDTSNVTKMSSMFYYMTNLLSIYVSNSWNTSSVTSGSGVFNYDYKVVGGAGTTYDANHTDKEYARVDDPANGKPGYFTLKTS